MSQLFKNHSAFVGAFDAPQMSEGQYQNPSRNEITPELLLKEGFSPLLKLALKYGYSKDHIGRLARTGRVDATRYGSKGDWYVREESLERYHRETNGRFITNTFAHAAGKASVPPLFPAKTQDQTVLSENESSLSAEQQTDVYKTSARGINAILAPALVMGGIFVFFTAWFFAPAVGAELRQASIFKNVSNVFARLFDPLLTAMPEMENYIVYESREIILAEEPAGGQPVSQPQPSLLQTVVINQTLNAADLEIVQAELNNAYLRLDSFQHVLTSLREDVGTLQRIRPAAVLPAYYAGTNPQTAIGANLLTTEKLTVTGETTLASLTISGVLTAASGDITGNLTVGGTLTVDGNIGIGTTLAPNELTVIGSGSFTGRLDLSRSPLAPHTGTWPSFTNLTDATLYMNPTSPVADGNIIVYSENGAARFIVDTEGDVFARNLVLTGSTTTGTTTVAGDFNVEGNTRLGDAPGDQIKFVGTILPNTLTSNIFNIQASPSWTGDYYFRVQDSSSNHLFAVASTGFVGVGTSGPVGTFDVRGGIAPSGAGAPIILAAQKGAASSNGGNIIFNSGENGSGASNGYIAFGAGSSFTGDELTTEKMRIARNGNIGIGGETDPVSRVEMRSVSTGSGFSGTNGAGALRISFSTGYGVGIDTWDGGTPRWGILNFSGDTPKVMIEGIYSSNDVFFNAGNVGIGTTSTAGKLDIVGDFAGSTAPLFRVASASELFRIQENGNVGIGTTGPVAQLHVAGLGAGSPNIWSGPTTVQNDLYGYKDFSKIIFNVNEAQALNQGLTSFTNISASGANGTGLAGVATTTGSNNTNIMIGVDGEVWPASSGTITHAAAFWSGIDTTNFTGTIASASGFYNESIIEAGSVTDLSGLLIGLGTKGAGASITNNYGVRISNQTVGTSNYAIHTNQTAGANNYALYNAGTAKSYFGGNVGIGTTNPTTTLQIVGSASVSSNFEVGGYASISGATILRGISYTWPSADGSADQFLQTNGAGLLSWATAGVASNSLDFDEFVNSMTLDANLTVASASFNTTWRGDFFHMQGNVGIGTTGPTRKLQVVSDTSGTDAVFITNTHTTASQGLRVAAGNDSGETTPCFCTTGLIPRISWSSEATATSVLGRRGLLQSWT